MKQKYTIIAISALALGFFIGRLTLTTKETVRLVQGKTVSAAIKVPEPTTEKVPDVPQLPIRVDTFRIENTITVTQKVDTAAIIREYITERQYDFNVFDDTNGKLDVSQTIQYNRLASFDYRFTPIQKEITRTRELVFVPFASGSYVKIAQGNYIGVGGGVFIGNVGIDGQYLVNERERGYLVGVKVRF